MSILDPNVRIEAGARLQSEIFGASAREPATLLEAATRDFVFSDVWSRPGLDRRSRFFIAIAASICSGTTANVLDSYVRGALQLGDITQGELREAALQIAAYGGWGLGAILDEAVTRVAHALGLPPVAVAPLQREPIAAQERLDTGNKKFAQIAAMPAPPAITPFFEVGILNFVFAELWTRPGLDQRGRRWVTLSCVATSSATTPIRAHCYGAMAAKDATLAEMQEFVLQFAIYGGWPKTSVVQAAVLEMGKRIAQNLPFE